MKSTLTPKVRKEGKLALLIAAHNEELVLGRTIESAIRAGMKPEHIYVVDDNSVDITSKIARELLPKQNVIKVRRSGKGLALTKASKKFSLTTRYAWIHIADADGAFSPNYFRVFRKELRIKYTAATGYIRSLPGHRVSEYRVMEYTVGMEIHRRLQVLFNVVPVIPGPSSCFRADVFDRVNFANKSMVEDFDVTIQLHRQKLGKIQFIPNAVTYTQDPRTTKDYVKQITRWNRGTLQSITRHKIGRKLSPIDIYLSQQIAQNLLFFMNYFLWVPYIYIRKHDASVLAAAFIVDVVVTFVIAFLSAMRTKRWDIISAFPHLYMLRWLSLGIFLKSFAEVIIFRKFRHDEKGSWDNNSTRRYVGIGT